VEIGRVPLLQGYFRIGPPARLASLYPSQGAGRRPSTRVIRRNCTARLAPIIKHGARIGAGKVAPFVAGPWGKKWATAELHLPYEGLRGLDHHPSEAARLMKALIAPTQPLVELAFPEEAKP
jgi:hypothetical protein